MAFLDYLKTPAGHALMRALDERAPSNTIFPPEAVRFRALQATLDSIKVVILGQDPYHQKNQADGLAFSVPEGIPAPPSLKNIFKALAYDLGCVRTQTDLSDWANQGVLLLNTLLTVEEGRPLSHQHLGYEPWIHTILKELKDNPKPKVFLLWGKHAQAYQSHIEAAHHHVIVSVHPSPLSAYRGFITHRPFSQANAFLSANGRGVIDFCGTKNK